MKKTIDIQGTKVYLNGEGKSTYHHDSRMARHTRNMAATSRLL
jgi:hypothetical protein